MGLHFDVFRFVLKYVKYFINFKQQFNKDDDQFNLTL